MRHFLIFYSYEQLPGKIKFSSFILEADSFPNKQYVTEKTQESLKKVAGNNKFLAITGITEVNLAEVNSYL
ncbi:hypothetical protein HC174_08745 [Salinimicrobium sp. CDJ15-81-2]|nr:hypothetical protein [Salinimicrobium nanhaiense]